ncbi:MAG: AP endonuclease [Phycisphaerae bacterium]|nr:AP endonuclease [Phycisphaerae bacterium]
MANTTPEHRRPVTLFTGQWADIPLRELAPRAVEMGFDGLELACWGDHFEVDKAIEDDGYVKAKRDLLESHGLGCWSISNHLVGQAVCDPIDARHKAILPARVWGNGPAGVNERAADEMKATAEAAKRFGVDVVNGFTGSPIWHKLYAFPPTSQDEIDQGFSDFANRWNPILDAFDAAGVRFALEVHPTEIAFDIYTAERALQALDHREAFGFNFDPSHLIWQGVRPERFINRFIDRIYHVHIKDAATTLDGDSGILASHLAFGDPRRGWDFRSPGRGDVDFESIIRALNRANYRGPLSIEWEDSAMDRFHGAAEACAYTRSIDFPSSDVVFDAAFDSTKDPT